MNKTALVPVADGTEEIEAVTIIDTLRRAGVSVTVASVGERQITASRGVRIVADCLIGDCLHDPPYDLIALPGGMPGAEHLRDSKTLHGLLQRQKNEGRLIAAICAAPVVVLLAHHLLENQNATGHPNFSPHLPNQMAVRSRVVVDGSLITSRAPGTAMEFALTLVEILCGRDKAAAVAQPMLVSYL